VADEMHGRGLATRLQLAEIAASRSMRRKRQRAKTW
jgi:hypothetical protein